jgi:hypothetical protein
MHEPSEADLNVAMSFVKNKCATGKYDTTLKEGYPSRPLIRGWFCRILGVLEQILGRPNH